MQNEPFNVRKDSFQKRNKWNTRQLSYSYLSSTTLHNLRYTKFFNFVKKCFFDFGFSDWYRHKLANSKIDEPTNHKKSFSKICLLHAYSIKLPLTVNSFTKGYKDGLFFWNLLSVISQHAAEDNLEVQCFWKCQIIHAVCCRTPNLGTSNIQNYRQTPTAPYFT